MNHEACVPEKPVDRGVDEERWFSLSEAGRFALAVASLDTEQESFRDFDEITKTLMATTAFDREKVVEINKSFRDKEYFDRSGFGTAGPLKLSLNDKGYKFLEKELVKVQ